MFPLWEVRAFLLLRGETEIFRESLAGLIDEVLAECSSHIAVSNVQQETTRTAITIYLVFNPRTHSFGDRLPPIVIDELDWENDDEIRRRLRQHIDNYLAERSKRRLQTAVSEV